jgi:hypothetical protein
MRISIALPMLAITSIISEPFYKPPPFTVAAASTVSTAALAKRNLAAASSKQKDYSLATRLVNTIRLNFRYSGSEVPNYFRTLETMS